jgi:hypothetical protein
MARGIGENPAKSPSFIVRQTEFPATRGDLVATAEDSWSPPEVINFFKSLPRERYGAAEEVLRDFAEAERVFAQGSRRNAGSFAARPNLNNVDDEFRHP